MHKHHHDKSSTPLEAHGKHEDHSHHEGHHHEEHGHQDKHEHGGGQDHHGHHAHMVEDFRKRFWISLILTVPILILSPMIQEFLGLGDVLRFPGDMYITFILSSFVFFYGGYPFLKGLFDELKEKSPGMMTLIALAISVAYFYSSAVVFGVPGRFFSGNWPP